MKPLRTAVITFCALSLAATPAASLPRTGLYLGGSPSSPRLQVMLSLYDGVLEVTWVPRHSVFAGSNQYALAGSLRLPLQVVAEHDQWPAITALAGYQRQQGGIGNATNAIEVGFKADKTIFPWMSVHALLSNASVFIASTPQGNVPHDLLWMPRLEIGASFHPAAPVYFHVGFLYWTGPAEINSPTTYMRGVRGYPMFLLGVNWQLSDLLGLPEPGGEPPSWAPASAAPSVSPSPGTP